MVLEKLPPHDIAAEEAVVAACLVDSEAIFKVAPILRPEDFFREKNGWVFEAARSLWDRNEAINQITVAHELARRDRLEPIGGVAYLAQIIADLPTVVGVEYYAQIVARDAIYRRLISAAGNIAQMAYEGGPDLEIVLGRAETLLMALRSGEALRDFVHIRTLLEKYLEDSGLDGQDAAAGPQVIRTGFIDLDTLLGGLKRSDLVILAARPSMGKCIARNATIVLSDGSVSTIEDICRRQEAELLTLGADWRLRKVRPVDFIDNGIRPVVRVSTRLGRRIDCTPNHPFLTLGGWQPLDALHVGDHIAVPRRIDVFGTRQLPEHQAKLLGYLLGDGGLTGSVPKFTNANPTLLEDFQRAVAEFGGLVDRMERAELCPVGSSDGRKNAKNRLTRWLNSLDLWGRGSHDKFIPDIIFQAPKHTIAAFLNRLFATDGWATVLASGQAQVGYATVSEQLARQVQHLLLRFGVIASLRARTVSYRGERRQAWQIDVTDAESIRVFADEIGIYGKEDAIARVLHALSRRHYQTNCDLIPVQVWDRLDQAKGVLSWAEVARRMGLPRAGANLHVGRRALSRHRLGRFTQVLSDVSLGDLAQGDIYWDRIDSIEYLGEQQVYDLTIPDTHNFVASDVIVHNSALAMAFARNAAVAQKAKVAVFTLEMSADQLAQRLLAAEANVDSTRLRLGEHTEAEERRIMHAMGVLAGCDIYIDDTPVLTVGEMRGKTLRLQREHGLDLVLVDYLQLMQGSSSGRNDNRVQEISMISRTLKTIARELNVPVVALSQLSRAVESRTPHIPMLSDLRESGCLTGDTMVALASGALAPIASLVGEQPEVVTLDGWRIATRQASKVWKTGHRAVFRMTTRTGRAIRATGNHRFRMLNGWKALDQLRPGDRIALPRVFPEAAPAQSWEPARVVLLGHLIGDGCYVPRQPLHYTSASEANLQAVADAAQAAFGIQGKRVTQENWYHLYLSAGANKWHPNPIRMWLRSLSIDGQRSFEKVVPAPVFPLNSEQIGLVLRHLWPTDGCVHIRTAGRRCFTTIYYSTSSSVLAGQVQHLLARLGIVSRTVRAQKQSYRPNYFVHVQGARDQLRFAEVVGGVNDREMRLRKVVDHLLAARANTNSDTVPIEVWDSVKNRMGELGISRRRMTAMRGTTYGGTSHFKFSPSRTVLNQYASLLRMSEIEDLAQSDVYWDTVDSIESDGTEDVYDMTIPGTHNFVANGIVVHNSIEQDADVVMFIYREDYYTRKEDWEQANPERPSRSFPAGVAQVIIAKHRNGPVGNVDLRFIHKTAKFEDLMVRDDEPA